MTTDSYGSARWADENDLSTEGIIHFASFNPDARQLSQKRTRRQYIASTPEAKAFILGKLGDPGELTKGIRQNYDSSMGGLLAGLAALWGGTRGGRTGNYLGWGGDGHVLSVAPTRSGKGIGLVIPNLLHYPGSVLVVDPKGENYAVTHRFREEVFGQQIVCLDPFHVMLAKDDVSDSINPFDGIVDYSRPISTYLTQNPELIDEANLIADALIMRGAEEKDPHWNDKCRTLLKGLILAVMCGKGPNKRRHLSEVRALVAGGADAFRKLLVDMEFDTAAMGGALSRASKEIQSMGTEELKNVISFALKHTEFLDAPLIEECLGDRRQGYHGTYDLRDLKKFGGVSIYMILPPHYLTRYVRLFRLWITMAMASMTRTAGKPADGCPVLFMMDEMAQLGTMEMMRQAVSLLAGYGMSVWMIWQDLSQLKALYEHDWPSFLANAKIQQFFGINDHETAKYVSEMLGNATIQVTSTSKSASKSKQNTAWFEATNTTNTSASFSETQRSLLAPDEVRRLNRKAMLMFVQGIPPILAERLAYFSDPMFASRFDPNPYV